MLSGRDLLLRAIPQGRDAHAEGLRLALSGEQIATVWSQLREQIGGELAAAQFAYVALSSRLLRRGLSVVILGPAGVGKSVAARAAVVLAPTGAVYELTAMSPMVLAYTQEPLAHRLLHVEELDSFHKHGPAAAIARGVIENGEVTYEHVITDEKSGHRRTERIHRPGPTVLLTTSTESPGPQLASRVVLAEVRTTRAQVIEAITVIARRAQGNSFRPSLAVVEFQQALSHLAGTEVAVPFAVTLAERLTGLLKRPDSHLTRNFRSLLVAIQTIALLNVAQRECDADGRLLATPQDYEEIRELFGPVFIVHSVAGATPEIAETVQAVSRLQLQFNGTVMAKQVGDYLGLGKSTVHYRLHRAIAAGYLSNQEWRPGRPMTLSVTDEIPSGAFALPTADEIAKAVTYHGSAEIGGDA